MYSVYSTDINFVRESPSSDVVDGPAHYFCSVALFLYVWLK